MITYTLNVQASSNEFEHAMDRFYTLIYAFQLTLDWMLLFLVQFKNFAQFKGLRSYICSSSFLSSYVFLGIVCLC